MASPTDAGRATTDVSTAADPWTVNLPASIASGNLLILFARNGNQQTLGTNTGWTTLVDDNADASNDRTVILYRVADGTEGATMSLDWAGTCKGAAIVWRVTGALTTGTFIEATVTANVDSNMDPGSRAVTSGPKDVLAIACGGLDGETQTFTEPSGYQNIQNANSGTGAAADTNVRVGGATLGISSTSSVDPGAFTNAAAATASGGTAVTIVVHPAAGGTTHNAASAMTLTMAFVTAATRIALAASSLTAVFSFASVAQRTATVSSAATFTFGLATAATRTAFASATSTYTFGFSTSANRTTFGASALPIVFGFTSSAGGAVLAASSLTLDMAFASQATRTATVASTSTYTVGIATAATMDARAASSLPIVFSVTTSASKSTTAASSLPIVFGFTTAGPSGIVYAAGEPGFVADYGRGRIAETLPGRIS